MIEQSITQTDPVLLPYLSARDEVEAARCLTNLITEQIEPLVKSIVGYKLRVCLYHNGRADLADVEDTCGEVLLHLLARLSEIKSNPRERTIMNFRGYVALTAYRACHDHLRRLYPQRYRLKNKLRYFLSHRGGFALWESADGEWLGGFASWVSQANHKMRHHRARELFDALPSIARQFLPQGTATTGASLDELLTGIFKWAEMPVGFDELVGVVAELWQVKDKVVDQEGRSAAATAFTNLADARSSTMKELDQRTYLAKLWIEIKQLSPRHCAALLLNLRDEQNSSAIESFLFTGTASFRQIAEALSRSEDWLAETWNYLPLADATIARHLGVSQQQVINLRKSARRRLAKRMGELGF